MTIVNYKSQVDLAVELKLNGKSGLTDRGLKVPSIQKVNCLFIAHKKLRTVFDLLLILEYIMWKFYYQNVSETFYLRCHYCTCIRISIKHPHKSVHWNGVVKWWLLILTWIYHFSLLEIVTVFRKTFEESKEVNW